ncbi:hypothetical protein LINPERHAP2_LOCUS11010 [Linum perenne]
MHEPDKLWAKLLKGLYFPNSAFQQPKKGDKASWIWASLCDARETLNLGARRNLMSGRSIRAYSDPWIPTLPGFTLSRHVVHQKVNPAQWMTQDRTQWDMRCLRGAVTTEEVDEIAPPPPPPPKCRGLLGLALYPR